MNYKSEFKKIGKGLLFVLFLIFLFTYFNPPIWAKWLILVGISAGFMLWGRDFTFKKLSKAGLYILAILLLIKWLGYFGLIGYILTIVIIAGSILIRKRKQYLKTMQEVEKKIWGKSLTEFKKEGKKPPKLKILK